MPIETTRMLALLQQVAEEVITPRFRALEQHEISSKTRPDDLVTVADQEAEVILTRELRAAYPDALVLGEEAFATRPGLVEDFRAAEHAFTVDPVDGTRNFVHGSPDHAVMVAETRAGTAVRSWIWQPQHRMAYVAERGAGALRVDATGHAETHELLPRLEPAADPASWEVRTSARGWLGERLGDTPPLRLTWVSCGIDYPKLVTGECDALVYRGTQPWDHVPGALLLAEVGGHVADLDGTAYGPRSRPRGILAGASEQVVRVLVPHVRALRA